MYLALTATASSSEVDYLYLENFQLISTPVPSTMDVTEHSILFPTDLSLVSQEASGW